MLLLHHMEESCYYIQCCSNFLFLELFPQRTHGIYGILFWNMPHWVDPITKEAVLLPLGGILLHRLVYLTVLIGGY